MELRHFADTYGLRDDPQVQARLDFLLDQDVAALVSDIDDLNQSLDTQHAYENGPQAKRKRIQTSNSQIGGGGGGDDEDSIESKPYYFWQTNTKTFKKTLATQTTYKVKFNDTWKGEKLQDITNQLHNMFDDVLNKTRGHDADLGRVVIEHPDLPNPIVVPLQPWEKMDADLVMDEISKVLNSHETLSVNESMTVNVGTIDVPKGGAKLPITSLFGKNNSLNRKQSLLFIENDNNLCLALAIGLCFLKTCGQVDPQTWANITESDNLSLVEKIMKYKKVPKSFYKNLLDKGRKKMQTDFALQLCQMANLPTNRYLGLNDIPPFERLLGVNVFVVSSRVGDKFIRAIDAEMKRNIFLYHVESDGELHWHGIANIQGFFNAKHFCSTCLQPFHRKTNHRCLTSCDVCFGMDCRVSDKQMCCRSCGRLCRSIDCFHRHKQCKGVGKKAYPSQCDTYYECHTCKKVLKRSERSIEEHICGEWKCSTCQRYHVGEHLCYQTATCYSDEDDVKKRKFIFYDMETRQDEKMQCDKGYNPSKTRCRICVGKQNQCSTCKLCRNCEETSCGLFYQHRVNFVVMQTSCFHCQDKELKAESKCFNCGKRCFKCGKREDKTGKFIQPPCPESECGRREAVFGGEDAAAKFCNYITQDHCKHFILIAHNAKSFDLYPILETLIDRHSIKPDKIIYSGSKIMYMHVANKLNLTFLDSLNFLPMKLAKIPGVFGLEELAKGYFPHFFNTMANQDYIGRYPPPETYGYNSMSKEDRQKFMEWYSTKHNDTFNFQEEMLKYCRSDVDILRKGCIQFRQLVIDVTGGVDPFEYVTIASLCMGIYKTLFLKEEYEVEIWNVEKQESSWYDIRHENDMDSIHYNGSWVALNELQTKEELKVRNRRFRKSPIGAIPSTGYVQKDTYSKVSIQWLEWIMEKQKRQGYPVFICHALNGGEVRIPNTNYRCDGFQQGSKGEKDTIYEFYGNTYLYRWILFLSRSPCLSVFEPIVNLNLHFNI